MQKPQECPETFRNLNTKDEKFYEDYFWNNGIPRGKSLLHKTVDFSENHYKIVSDPYYKWISLERYCKGKFIEILYDSRLFDFRSLKETNQIAWEKEFLEPKREKSLIRNQDDRIILFEEYIFEKNRCRICKTRSVHNIPLSKQMIYYTEFGDSFNGVVLFDTNHHPIMYKIYEADIETGEFTALKEENWNMDPQKIHMKI